MELSDFLEVSLLMDYYKNLLSDKQKEYMLEHFERDLSLSEIAKEHNVSRQAVYDNIRRGIKILKEYEDKIGFYKREQEIKDSLLKLRKEFTLEKLEEIIESIDL
ncbi:YlxM family DNA-binding protein [uncultured Ilyobacter sp.]|uniref:YlxM family DNA-binding protein n=1 Tax=uncultured Ilyobacter sp. TaxID=544433 RepID=UPI0029C6F6D2|nr:sigma factor-like helix-turn-helix DNA-binding protein [uncultured Ilyobacter sp.]